MTKHNKKRNIGIIYELFSRHITNLVLSNQKNKIKKATNILEKRFKKGTELYKEFRLFNALVNANVSSKNKAILIVENAKKEVLNIDNEKLNYEKSKLIKEINYDLNDKSFYYRSVPNYREYANLQNLFNDWREKDNNNLKLVIEKEEKAIQWLIREKVDINIEKEHSYTPDQTSKLVLNIMTEKINKKYNNLSDDQKQIIRNYALYAVDDVEKFESFLKEKKRIALQEIVEFRSECANKIILEKISDVEKRIQKLSDNPKNDADIIKYLTISGLIKELKE